MDIKKLSYRIGFPSLYYPKISLGEYLDNAVRKYGEKTALIYAEPRFPSDLPDTMTFNMLGELTNRLANSFLQLGISKGSRVGVMLPNSPDYVVVTYANWKLGAIQVPINWMYKEYELEFVLKDAEVSTLVIHSNFYHVFQSIREKVQVEKIIVVGGEVEGAHRLGRLIEQGEAKPLVSNIDPVEDVATICYTGGTTGPPKGVMLTHYNLVSNAIQLATAFGVSHMDTHVGSMPMFHMAEFGFFNVLLGVGGTYVIMGMFNPMLLAENIEKYQATISWAVPPAYALLISYLESKETRNYDWRFLKCFATGAWPVAKALIDRMRKVAAEKCNNPNLLHNQVWGMTEASPMCTSNPPLRLDKTERQGIPLPDIELKIVDIETGKEIDDINKSGEIVISGPNIFKGYWKRPEEDAKAWWIDPKTGKKFFRTGDIGYIDEEGFLIFQDRIKEVIKYKGYTIAPFELEALLLKHEAVQDVAVIGKPDPDAGEIPKAFVVLKPEYKGSVSADEIIEWVRERISGYKRIREVEFVDALPRTPSGKLLRRVLREKEIEKIKKKEKEGRQGV
ncbi:MAG: AMP-binding protein [Archaeoglobaceae archaeon]